MPDQLPAQIRELVERQHGVISWRQATTVGGLGKDLIASRVRSGKWQRLHTGVYAVFTGAPDRQAILWAAVLRAGEGAALSYHTAAELDNLIDKPASLIHVTIPASRRVSPIRGVLVHVRLGAGPAIHPVRLPPRTRIEETVLDLAEGCGAVDDAIGWVTAALGRGLTSQGRLRETLASRARMRWRADISSVLSPDLAGVHSALEYRYLRDVERPHHLPQGRHQAQVTRSDQHEYRDVLYEEYAVAVELDGRVAHPGDTRWNDIHRDNFAAATGTVTLRYGYLDVTVRPCLVAAELDQVLRVRGWQGSAHPCSRACPIRRRP